MKTKELEFAINEHYFNSSKIITTKLTKNSGIVSHECDVVVVTKADYLLEFELKVSKADLKKDFKKNHSHECNKIKKTFYVIPHYLRDCIELIPEKFGVILVYKDTWIDKFMLKVPLEKTMYRCSIYREGHTNKEAEKITIDEYIKLCKLASMRYWTCKENELKNEGLIQWNKAKICDTCKHKQDFKDFNKKMECKGYLINCDNCIGCEEYRACVHCSNCNKWEDKNEKM